MYLDGDADWLAWLSFFTPDEKRHVMAHEDILSVVITAQGEVILSFPLTTPVWRYRETTELEVIFGAGRMRSRRRLQLLGLALERPFDAVQVGGRRRPVASLVWKRFAITNRDDLDAEVILGEGG